MLTVDGQEYLVMPYPVLQFFLFPTRLLCSDCSRICYVAFSVALRFNQQWRSQHLDVGGTAGLGDRSPPAGSRGQAPESSHMHNFVYLAKLYEPRAKHEKNPVSAAESLSNSYDRNDSGTDRL